MKKTSLFLLLLLSSFSLMSFSFTNNKTKEVITINSLKKYVGDYIYEEAGITIKIYTKENNTKLFLFVSGQPEYELVKTGKHKFSFKVSDEYKVEFKNPENGIFKELVATQTNGNIYSYS